MRSFWSAPSSGALDRTATTSMGGKRGQAWPTVSGGGKAVLRPALQNAGASTPSLEGCEAFGVRRAAALWIERPQRQWAGSEVKRGPRFPAEAKRCCAPHSKTLGRPPLASRDAKLLECAEQRRFGSNGQ